MHYNIEYESQLCMTRVRWADIIDEDDQGDPNEMSTVTVIYDTQRFVIPVDPTMAVRDVEAFVSLRYSELPHNGYVLTHGGRFLTGGVIIMNILNDESLHVVIRPDNFQVQVRLTNDSTRLLMVQSIDTVRILKLRLAYLENMQYTPFMLSLGDQVLEDELRTLQSYGIVQDSLLSIDA